MKAFFKTVLVLACAVAGMIPTRLSAAKTENYAVVITGQTRALDDWAAVAKTLCRKHDATLVVAAGKLEACEADLKRLQPRYVSFVARPEEITTDTVREIHQLSRRMDDDPFADFMWGIVTGWDAADALRIAKTSKPLVVHTALTTTGMNFDLLDAGLTISDGRRGEWTLKEKGHTTIGTVTNLPASSSDGLFREFWETHDVDLLLTSGHATQVNLEMSWSLGAIVCANGLLYPLDRVDFRQWVRRVSRGTASGGYWFASTNCVTLRQEWAANTKIQPLKASTHPKVFFGVGNCLIGDTLGIRDSMVTAWLGRAGVDQFVAYTIPTWYGKGGWGALDLRAYGGHRARRALGPHRGGFGRGPLSRLRAGPRSRAGIPGPGLLGSG